MKTILLLVITTTLVFAQSHNVNTEVSKSAERSDNGSISFTVADENGTELYTINKQTEFDIPYPNLVVFGDGSSVLLYAFNGRLEFYNANGTFRFERLLFKELNAHYERTVYADASEEELTILVSEPNKSTRLYMYDVFGNENSNVNIGDVEATGVAIAGNGGVVAVGTQRWSNEGLRETTSIYGGGAKTAEYELSFRGGGFVMNDAMLMGYNNKSAFVIDVAGNEVLINRAAGEDEVIVSAEFVGGGLVTVTSPKAEFVNMEWVYPGGVVRSYDLNNEMIFEKGIDEQFTTVNISRVKDAVIIDDTKAIRLSE